jgi:outer membrane lipoprotein-sorting protein
MRAIWSLTMTAALAVAAPTMASDDAEARALLKAVLEHVPTEAFVADGLLSSGGGWERQLTMSNKQVGDERATLIEVTGPADVAGTRFLFLERTEGRDRQWIFLPAMTGRAIEVMDDAKREPFLGSDFWVVDMVAPNMNDFTYTFVGDEEIDGRKCRLLEAAPKPGVEAPYAKTISAVDPAEMVIVRVESFDDDGKPFKVWTLERLDDFKGQKVPTKQRMKNLKSKSESTLELKRVEFNADIPDSRFSKEHLTRQD